MKGWMPSIRPRSRATLTTRFIELPSSSTSRPAAWAACAIERMRPTLDEKVVIATRRSEEHTSELQSLMRISYAVFCLKKNNNTPHLQPLYHLTKKSQNQ